MYIVQRACIICTGSPLITGDMCVCVCGGGGGEGA